MNFLIEAHELSGFGLNFTIEISKPKKPSEKSMWNFFESDRINKVYVCKTTSMEKNPYPSRVYFRNSALKMIKYSCISTDGTEQFNSVFGLFDFPNEGGSAMLIYKPKGPQAIELLISTNFDLFAHC